ARASTSPAGLGIWNSGSSWRSVFREDSWDATGARTFLSAATLNESRAFKGSDPVEDSRVAADKNVRAPLWFRLRRPGNTAPYLIENCCWRPVAHCARRILCVSLLVIMYR